jgi:hypothetical protein
MKEDDPSAREIVIVANIDYEKSVSWSAAAPHDHCTKR